MRCRIHLMRHSPLAALFAAFIPAFPLAAQSSSVEELLDFTPGFAAAWFVVNDGVMGGRSSSTIRAGNEGIAVFEGYLSLENNGGFASVRTELPRASLAGVSKIVLRVRGDGNRYELRLRPGRQLDGVAFRAGFDTIAGEWITVELPTQTFEPSFRGYRPRGTGPLIPSQVRQLGIMLTDKQEGQFRLDIDWIGVHRGDG